MSLSFLIATFWYGLNHTTVAFISEQPQPQKWKNMPIGHGCIRFQFKVNRGINSRKEKVEMSEIKLGLSFMVDDLVNKFQIICSRGT